MINEEYLKELFRVASGSTSKFLFLHKKDKKRFNEAVKLGFLKGVPNSSRREMFVITNKLKSMYTPLSLLERKQASAEESRVLAEKLKLKEELEAKNNKIEQNNKIYED